MGRRQQEASRVRNQTRRKKKDSEQTVNPLKDASRPVLGPKGDQFWLWFLQLVSTVLGLNGVRFRKEVQLTLSSGSEDADF